MERTPCDRIRHVVDLSPRLPQPAARPAPIHRDRGRDRLFHGACDRPAGPLSGVRAHSDHDDRPRVRRSLDHAGRDEVLRRPLVAGRAQALPSAVDQRGGRSRSRRHRLRRLAGAGRRNDAGLHRRFGFASRRIASLEFGRRQHRCACDAARHRGRPLLLQPARDRRARRQRRNSRAEGGGEGGHQGHPVVHHDALRVHDGRSRARLYRIVAEQGHLSSRTRRPRGRCAERSTPNSRQISPMSTC